MNENKKRERDFYVDRLTGIYNREGFLERRGWQSHASVYCQNDFKGIERR